MGDIIVTCRAQRDEDYGDLMLKPIVWKTFPRDFIVIQIGFALFGLSIALMIRSNVGTTPWAVLEVALSHLTNIRPGRMSIIVGMVVLIGSLVLRERIGWGTLGKHHVHWTVGGYVSFIYPVCGK